MESAPKRRGESTTSFTKERHDGGSGRSTRKGVRRRCAKADMRLRALSALPRQRYVMAMNSTTTTTARLRVPSGADTRRYALTDYADLYSLPADNGQRAPFFDTGGKVRGAERKERFIFSLGGVDSAGQPRANDQIKLHFDQSTWSDQTIYDRFLRLPPGTL